MTSDEMNDKLSSWVEPNDFDSLDEKDRLCFMLMVGFASLWPKAQGGEFEITIRDGKGKDVVHFGGTVPIGPHDPFLN